MDRQGGRAGCLLPGWSVPAVLEPNLVRRGGLRPSCRGTPAVCSLDHFVGTGKQRLGNREAEGLGGREVDDEIELRRPFYRQIARLRALENLIDIACRAPVHIRDADAVGHEAAVPDVVAEFVHRGETVASGEREEKAPVDIEPGAREDLNGLGVGIMRGPERAVEVGGLPDLDEPRPETHRLGRRDRTGYLFAPKGLIPQERETREPRDRVDQELDLLRDDLLVLRSEAGDVAARVGETADEAGCDRVDEQGGTDDRNLVGGRAGCLDPGTSRDHEKIALGSNELGREVAEPFALAMRPPILDLHVLPFDPTEIPETLTKGVERLSRALRITVAEVSDSGRRFRGELRAGHERSDEKAAAERAEEHPPCAHWISSSARPRSACGIVRPRALALLRLMASSNLMGCSTGRSPGLAPFRILSTKTAARRHMSFMSGP